MNKSMRNVIKSMELNRPHIIINKQLEGDWKTPGYKMWNGICLKCMTQWRFWFFGATLGFGLEHIRRCSR